VDPAFASSSQGSEGGKKHAQGASRGKALLWKENSRSDGKQSWGTMALRNPGRGERGNAGL